jgi:hypothetical protein
VDHRGFIKKLDVPSGITVPTTLTYDDVVAWLAERLPFAEPYYSNREIPAD